MKARLSYKRTRHTSGQGQKDQEGEVHERQAVRLSQSGSTSTKPFQPHKYQPFKSQTPSIQVPNTKYSSFKHSPAPTKKKGIKWSFDSQRKYLISNYTASICNTMFGGLHSSFHVTCQVTSSTINQKIFLHQTYHIIYITFENLNFII